jgi:LacI family transcriptional regulator
MFAKTTLEQVARKVGVSASTVSRVLNGARGVNEGTRERVLGAIRTINYRPGVSRAATGQGRLIGFLMPAEAEQWGVRTNFTEQGLSAISDVATRFNYGAMVGSYSPESKAKVEDDMIAHREFAGALLFRTKDEIRDSQPFRDAGIPILIVNRLLPDTVLNYIGPDHFQIGFAAVENLLRCGYRRIGFLIGKTSYASHRLYQEGFHRAHAAAGLPANAKLITEIELNTEGGYTGTRRVAQITPRPDALIVTGDRASLGCLKALADLKLKVPKDIGVLTIDGTPETAFANPSLTAVEIPWYDMLAMGTRLLIDLIEHRSLVEQIGVRFSTRLVVRKSTQSKQMSVDRDSVKRRTQRC